MNEYIKKQEKKMSKLYRQRDIPRDRQYVNMTENTR